jgi:hypothetical protein
MRKVFPHQVFHYDFDTMLEEGKRQEEMCLENQGEYELAKGIHAYFSRVVMPLVVRDDHVFQVASLLVKEYINAYFLNVRISSKEAYEVQQELHQLKDAVRDFFRRHPPKALVGQEIRLAKLSDFLTVVELDELHQEAQEEAAGISEWVKDHETLLLTVTLRNIRDCYEMALPRVMFVVRRAMKVSQGIQGSSSDHRLLQPSDYVDWFECHANSHHPFQSILGNQSLIEFYKVARNVASHHYGLRWEPSTSRVILKDRAKTLSVPLKEFQQRYRYLVYLCDYSLRGIFSAFAEREKGPLSDKLLDEYNKTFPSGFPMGEQVAIRYYTR